jgi:tetratricopeptide (TPR) repeat protein
MADKDYVSAAELLERASAYEPDNPRIRRELGLAYVGQSNPGKALENFLKAARGAPDDLETQYWIGRLSANQRQSAAAVTAFRTALLTSQAAPEDPLVAESLLRLGELLAQSGRFQAALDCYARLAQWIERHEDKYRDNALLRTVLLEPERITTAQGEMLLKLGKHDRAAQMLLKAYEQNRSSAATGRMLLEALAHTGQYAQARKLLVELAQDESRRGEAGMLGLTLITAQIRGGKPADAMNTLAELIAARPLVRWYAPQAVRAALDAAGEKLVTELSASKGNFARSYVAALAAHLSGKPQLAAPQYQAAWKDGQYPPAYEGLLELALEAGDRRRVEALLNEAGDGAFADYLRGKVELHRGNLPQAITTLEQARQRQPMHLPTLMLLAQALESSGQIPAATRVLLAALAVDADNPDVYRRLYAIYYSAQRYDEAQAAADKFLSRYPDMIDAKIMAAELQLATGRLDKARTMIAEIARLAPNHPDLGLLVFRAELGSNVTTLPADAFDRAASRLGEIIARNPSNLVPKRMLADMLVKRGENAKAAEVLAQLYAQTGQQDVGKAYAVALMASRQDDKAAEVLGQRLAAEPGDLWAQENLLAVLDRQGQDKRQMELLEKWLIDMSDGPTASRYRARLLRLYREEQRFDDAQALLDVWIAGANENTLRNALIYRKLTYHLAARQYTKAVEVASKLSTAAPSRPVVLQGVPLDKPAAKAALALYERWLEQAQELSARGSAQFQAAARDVARSGIIEARARMGEVEQALDQALKWAKDDPLNMQANYAVVAVLDAAERDAQVVEFLRSRIAELKKVASTQPAAPAEEESEQPLADDDATKASGMLLWCRSALANHFMRRDRFEQAAEAAEEAISADPKLTVFYHIKAAALEAQGKRQDALGVVEAGLKAAPNDWAMANGVAYSLAESGTQLDRAERLARQALAKPGVSESPAVNDTLAWVLYKRGRIEEAVRIFKMALELDSPDAFQPVIIDHAGDACWRSGQKQRAAALWARAVAEAKLLDHPNHESKAAAAGAQTKLDALKAGKPPQVAPLGKDVTEATTRPATAPAKTPD